MPFQKAAKGKIILFAHDASPFSNPLPAKAFFRFSRARMIREPKAFNDNCITSAASACGSSSK